MPARVMIVHDDPTFIAMAIAALKLAGQDAIAFTDPMAALDALDAAKTVEILVTRVIFGPRRPHGISLARLAQRRRPTIRVLFTALPEFAESVRGIGEFLPMPVRMPDFVEAVGGLLPVPGLPKL